MTETFEPTSTYVIDGGKLKQVTLNAEGETLLEEVEKLAERLTGATYKLNGTNLEITDGDNKILIKDYFETAPAGQINFKPNMAGITDSSETAVVISAQTITADVASGTTVLNASSTSKITLVDAKYEFTVKDNNNLIISENKQDEVSDISALAAGKYSDKAGKVYENSSLVKVYDKEATDVTLNTLEEGVYYDKDGNAYSAQLGDLVLKDDVTPDDTKTISDVLTGENVSCYTDKAGNVYRLATETSVSDLHAVKHQVIESTTTIASALADSTYYDKDGKAFTAGSGVLKLKDGVTPDETKNISEVLTAENEYINKEGKVYVFEEGKSVSDLTAVEIQNTISTGSTASSLESGQFVDNTGKIYSIDFINGVLFETGKSLTEGDTIGTILTGADSAKLIGSDGKVYSFYSNVASIDKVQSTTDDLTTLADGQYVDKDGNIWSGSATAIYNTNTSAVVVEGCYAAGATLPAIDGVASFTAQNIYKITAGVLQKYDVEAGDYQNIAFEKGATFTKNGANLTYAFGGNSITIDDYYTATDKFGVASGKDFADASSQQASAQRVLFAPANAEIDLNDDAPVTITNADGQVIKLKGYSLDGEKIVLDYTTNDLKVADESELKAGNYCDKTGNVYISKTGLTVLQQTVAINESVATLGLVNGAIVDKNGKIYNLPSGTDLGDILGDPISTIESGTIAQQNLGNNRVIYSTGSALKIYTFKEGKSFADLEVTQVIKDMGDLTAGEYADNAGKVFVVGKKQSVIVDSNEDGSFTIKFADMQEADKNALASFVYESESSKTGVAPLLNIIDRSNSKASKIVTSAEGAVIAGSTKNDKIYLNGNSIVFADAGNDRIYANGTESTLIFSSGDGNDVVYGSTNNTKYIFEGTANNEYTYSKVGASNDLKITYKQALTVEALTDIAEGEFVSKTGEVFKGTATVVQDTVPDTTSVLTLTAETVTKFYDASGKVYELASGTSLADIFEADTGSPSYLTISQIASGTVLGDDGKAYKFKTASGSETSGTSLADLAKVAKTVNSIAALENDKYADKDGKIYTLTGKKAEFFDDIDSVTIANYFGTNGASLGGLTVDNVQISGKGKITGTEFKDVITGSNKSDKIYNLGAGDDVISAYGGNDVIDLTGLSGTKTINITSGRDTIIGSTSNVINVKYNGITDIQDYDYAISGDDLIISAGKNSVTIKDYESASNTINVAGSTFDVSNVEIDYFNQNNVATSTLKGGEIGVAGTNKNDKITFNSTSASEIYATLGKGNDIYTFDSVNTAQIETIDTKGNDTYQGTSNANVSIKDTNGADTYELINNASLSIIDTAKSNDTYNITTNTTSSAGTSIIDNKGNDKYSITSTKGNTSIVDIKGNDFYEITSLADGKVTITDNSGKNTLQLTNSKYEDLVITFERDGSILIKDTNSNGVLEYNGTLSAIYTKDDSSGAASGDVVGYDVVLLNNIRNQVTNYLNSVGADAGTIAFGTNDVTLSYTYAGMTGTQKLTTTAEISGSKVGQFGDPQFTGVPTP